VFRHGISAANMNGQKHCVALFFSSSLLSSLGLSDTQVCEPSIRALLGTAPHFCQVVVLKSRTVPNRTTLSLRILRVIRRGAQAMYNRGTTHIASHTHLTISSLLTLPPPLSTFLAFSRSRSYSLAVDPTFFFFSFALDKSLCGVCR